MDRSSSSTRSISGSNGWYVVEDLVRFSKAMIFAYLTVSSELCVKDKNDNQTDDSDSV